MKWSYHQPAKVRLIVSHLVDESIHPFYCLLLYANIVVPGVPPQRRMDRQINEEVRRMMTALFNVLEGELNNFILSFEKLDSL